VGEMSALACNDKSSHLRIFVQPAEELLTVYEFGLGEKILRAVVNGKYSNIILGMKLR